LNKESNGSNKKARIKKEIGTSHDIQVSQQTRPSYRFFVCQKWYSLLGKSQLLRLTPLATILRSADRHLIPRNMESNRAQVMSMPEPFICQIINLIFVAGLKPGSSADYLSA